MIIDFSECQKKTFFFFLDDINEKLARTTGDDDPLDMTTFTSVYQSFKTFSRKRYAENAEMI